MKFTEPPAVVVQAEADVKQVFRNGWSHAGRVAGWAKGTVRGEFADPAGRSAWRAALAAATAGLTVGDAADMGTGPGTVSQLWAEAGWRTTGLDFSPAMLAQATAAAADRGLSVELVEGDVERPRLGGRRFDVVSSRLVLFTLPHPGLAVRRWVQMLRPGGRLVLIGEDHPDRHGPPPADRPSTDHPSTDRPPGAWQADATYKAALDRLPFMWHTSADLAVVMEAAGLDDVRRVPMDAVVAARAAMADRGVDFRVFRSQPFLLVGEKASTDLDGRGTW